MTDHDYYYHLMTMLHSEGSEALHQYFHLHTVDETVTQRLFTHCLYHNHSEALQVIIEHSTLNIDATNPFFSHVHDTPLMAACRNRLDQVARVLLKAGARINLCPRNGLAPIILATSANSLVCVKLLIEHGADLEAQHIGQITSLGVAAHYGRADLVQALASAGARLDRCSDDGKSALQIADGYPECIAILKAEQEKRSISQAVCQPGTTTDHTGSAAVRIRI